MDFEQVERELTAWHETRRRMLREKTRRCIAGPSMAAVYLALTGRWELTAEELRHVEECEFCRRQRDRIKATLRSDDGEPGLGGDLDNDPTRRRKHKTASRARPRGVGLSRLFGHRARRWAYGTVGLAVAASILLAIGILWQPTPAMADDALLRQVAMRLVFLPDVDPFLSDDPATVQSVLNEIDDFRRQRDDAIHEAATAPDAQSHAKAAHNALQPWAFVYRRLRDLGRFDEALAEIDRCMQYCRTHPALGKETGWYRVMLADLGSLHLSMADLPNARRAYQDSIDAREKSRQAFLSRKDNPVTVPDRASNEASELGPLYWSMSRVAIAEGDFQDAHKWLQLSDRAFRTYFAAVCEAVGTTCPANGDALTAFNATPLVFQAPPPRMSDEEHARFAAEYRGFVPSTGLNTKLHAHLYFTACLALAEGKVSAANQTLSAAKDVPVFSCADEDRLDFYEPLLAARIAIAERRYQDADAFIAEAERHSGPPPCSDIANNRPIASARIAELTLLKGVALLGLDEKSEAGRHLVEKALSVPTKLSETLPIEQRELFLNQFGAWKQLLDFGSNSSSLIPRRTEQEQ